MNDKLLFIKSCFFVPAVFLLLNLSVPSFAQQPDQSQATEVYLTFQYRGIFNVYITAYYQDDRFYVPVSEIFNALQVNHSIDQGNLTVSGTYLGKKEYYFNFSSQNPKAQAGDKEVLLSAEDYLIKEIDYFVHPEIFNTLFGLDFTIDFNNLNLNLETTDKMPVVAQYERDQKRQQLDRSKAQFQQNYYPLQYNRDYSSLDGAFLDYNITSIFTRDTELFMLSNALGIELLGGDLEGNTFAALSDNQRSFTTNGLRWRYVQRNNDFFSSAIIGQTNSEGIGNRSITGVKISNQPVEPRILFDRYVVDGTVPAQSEVELYLNNQLVDFQETDQSGNYRFVVPLTYGSTNYSVRIYTPEGRSFNRESRVQIPFDYLPAGELDYTASFGQLSNPIFGTINDRGYHTEGTVSAGLSNWLTVQTSAEYITTFHNQLPSFTGTLNARLLSRYLVSINANTENFYRFTSSVVYGSGASWNISYDYNPGQSRLFNAGGNDHQARVNLFTPFVLGNIPLNIRWSSTYLKNGPTSLVRYRADLNTRLGKLNIRFGYRDQQITPVEFTNTISSRLTNSYTYSIGRTKNIPKLIRGSFIRAQLSYLPGLDRLEEVEFQLSREFLNTGRIQLSYGHNFLRDFNTLSLNLTLNFNKVRSNTTSRTTGSQFAVNQSFRGSIGYDSYGDQLILNNRQQVGQSGVAVRLFVDNNNDGAYQDSLDDVIPDPAVRLDRAGGRTFVDDGVNYVTQLLPYYRYNMQINKSALSNPLLVPDVDNFSIVTDPNQFKKVEIPFYLSGVISGRVDQLQSDSTLQALGGVRVFLKSNFSEESNRDPITKELRTFSDGSFYTYEIPPGKYLLYIDPNQLEFLDATSKPDTLNFEVEALAQGDFVENLNFVIEPDDLQIEDAIVTENRATDTTINEQKNQTNTFFSDSKQFQIQLGSYATLDLAENAANRATKMFGDDFTTIYNKAANLYGIRSNIYNSRTDAIKVLFDYQNSEFSEPALVVIKNRGSQKTETTYYAIQISAFRSLSRAKKDAALSSIKLDTETYIHTDKEAGWFKVHILKTQPFDILAFNLREIKQKSFFNDAFINSYSPEGGSSSNNLAAAEIRFKYQVHVEGVTEESAQTFRSSIMNQENTDSNISQPETDLIVFENIESWKEVVQLKNNLSKVSTIGKPVIVIVEQ